LITTDLQEHLDELSAKYNNKSFIEDDPISIPHAYSLKQDIEIAGLWTAILAWGQRKTIINKARELFHLMDDAPYDFIVNHRETDRKQFLSFKHRTFQPEDTLYFLHFFQNFYREHSSLETCFFPVKGMSVKEGLSHFRRKFFGLNAHLKRTEKHVSTPASKSSCKRLNMFLRWMVRTDTNLVDFGLWKQISPAELMIPLDIHVFRVARRLGLLEKDRADWAAVEELTAELRRYDPSDPVKYDFALFNLGVNKEFL
jgi:uncharacterized protein (TIGR02757 family)